MNKVTSISVFLSLMVYLNSTSYCDLLLPEHSLEEEGHLAYYTAKDFSYLIGMEGFSKEALEMHFKLYEGYVKNTNLLLKILYDYVKENKEETPQFGAIKQRLAFELDGMRLHELYFSNLGGKEEIDRNTSLYKQIIKDFGTFETWKQNFINTGMIRGIGWVILYLDPVNKQLINMWISEHQENHLVGGIPILIMDVWEHAYMIDYGLNRMNYINAFWNKINWSIVSSRYDKSF
ncbi:MAG: superoxide dismutase [Chlamydiales bacterium]